jgi:hypothetical protein
VGVTPSSSAADINSACKKELFKYHPDKNPGHEEEFKKVNNACEVLRDADKRKSYDASLGSSSSSSQGGTTTTTGTLPAIEGPSKDDAPKTWLDKMKAKAEGLAKGKEEKISNFIGDLMAKIPIPDQSAVLFNQSLTIKDLSFVQAPIEGDIKMGLGFTGTVQFNKFQIKGTIFAFIDKKDNKQVSVEMDLPDQYSLVDMFPSWKNSVVEKLKMPKGRMVVTSIDYSSEGWSVRKGLNFTAFFDLSGPVEVLDTLRKKAVSMPGVIAEGGEASIGGYIPQDIQKTEFKAAIPLKLGVDFTQIKKVPESVSAIFKKIYTTEFYVKALPAKQKLEAGGKMELVLGTQPEVLEFVIQGSIERQLVSIAGNMNGMIELKWAAIGDLAIQIDIDQSTLPAAAAVGCPFTGIGFRGKLDLGKPGDKRANLSAAGKVSFKGSQIPDLLIDMEGKNIHLDDFIVFMSEVAAKQGITPKPINKDKMPTIKIDYIKGYFAPADTEIGTKEYKKGILLEADANLFDHKMGMSFFLDPDPKNIRLSGKGYFDPIDIKSNGETVIKLSGSGCKSGGGSSEAACIEFDFQEKKPAEATFFVTGNLEIPKLSVAVGTRLDFSGKKFNGKFDAKIQESFMVAFALAIEEKKLEEFEASFEFKGDFGKFMNELVLPAVKELKSTAVIKAAQADEDWKKANADWKKFNEEKGVVERELEKHRAEVDAAKNKVAAAEALLNKLTDAVVKKQWDKLQADKAACERAEAGRLAAHAKTSSINPLKHPIDYGKAAADELAAATKWKDCLGVVSSGTSWLAAKGLQGITQVEVKAAQGVLEGYKQATKSVDAGRIALTAISNKVNQASAAVQKAAPLKDTTAKVVGALEKVVDLLAQGAQIVNIKEAKGSVSGKELSAGKLPKLERLDIALAIPDKVPQIGGKSKSIVLKDLQFDFKNAKESGKSIAKSLAQTIKDMVAS